MFVAVDHCTCKLVGVVAAARATRCEALEPIRQGVREHFGGISSKIAQGLKLRHDNGTQYLADDFQREIAFLGIESSPLFVWAPGGNGCAERIIRTLKEHLLWVRSFDSIEDALPRAPGVAQAVQRAADGKRHDHRSPSQVLRDHYAAEQPMAA